MNKLPGSPSQWETQFCLTPEPMCLCVCWHVQLFEKPRAIAGQAPLSMGFSRQEYWSVLPFPSPEDLPNPGIEPTSPKSLALTGRFFTTAPPGLLSLLPRCKYIYYVPFGWMDEFRVDT